jgi:hypothetical protein
MSKKYYFSISLPPLTWYNRDAEYKKYKEMATLGLPTKQLVAISGGLKQKDFMNLLSFENDYLKLQDRLIPLSSSYTTPSDSSESGAPELPDDKKSDKTLLNEESQ